MEVAERFTRVDGLNTRYLEVGEGPEIVLLHGASLGSCANTWDRNLVPLASFGFRVIAYDDPGYGLSDNPAEYTADYREVFLIKFLDALGFASANVLGHSQGGGVALYVVLKHPERFTKLMVLGPARVLPPLEGINPEVWEFGEELTREPTVEVTREMTKDHVFDESTITPEALEVRQRMSVGPCFEAYLWRRRAPRGPVGPPRRPLWQRLDEVSVPLLMVFGADDHRGYASKRVPLLREKYPGLRIEVLDRCGHLMQWDAAGRLEELAASFFGS